MCKYSQVLGTVEVTDSSIWDGTNTCCRLHSQSCHRSLCVPIKVSHHVPARATEKSGGPWEEDDLPSTLPLFQKQQAQVLGGESQTAKETQRTWVTASF